MAIWTSGALGQALAGVSAPLPLVGAGGAISLDLDNTVWMMMVVFVALGFVLKPLLFDPVLKVFEERELRTEGARAEAREMQQKAGELLEKYELELAKVHRFVAEEGERVRAETLRLEAQLLGEARATANRVLEQGRERIATEVQALRGRLGVETKAVADAVVREALGREVAS